MQKVKIIHIHTDQKFISESVRYNNKSFENVIILIGRRNDENRKIADSSFLYRRSLKNLHSIIELCNSADIVILYNLCSIKGFIANRLSTKVKIIWRFFGTELYGRISYYGQSEKTIKARKGTTPLILNINIGKFISPVLNLIRFRTTLRGEFERAAFRRINFFHGISEKEYLFLKQTWPRLPPFLQINYTPYTEVRPFNKTENNLILVGNNRSPYNNHLDIIALLKQSNEKTNYRFLMIFNYGQNTHYTDIVRTKALEVKEIEILEDFLSRDEFSYMYANASAFIMNGYRQMSMGNIWEAIKNNTKVYLNDKNIMLHWLKEEGFYIFSIEDLISDLDDNTIQLTPNEALHNQTQLITLTRKFSKQKLHDSLMEMAKVK